MAPASGPKSDAGGGEGGTAGCHGTGDDPAGSCRVCSCRDTRGDEQGRQAVADRPGFPIQEDRTRAVSGAWEARGPSGTDARAGTAEVP